MAVAQKQLQGQLQAKMDDKCSCASPQKNLGMGRPFTGRGLSLNFFMAVIVKLLDPLGPYLTLLHCYLGQSRAKTAGPRDICLAR